MHPYTVHLSEWQHVTAVDVSVGGVVFDEIDNVTACVAGTWRSGDDEPAWRIARIIVRDIRRGNDGEAVLIYGDPWFTEMQREIAGSTAFIEACREHTRETLASAARIRALDPEAA